MDYRKLIEFHLEKNADLTVAFTKVVPEASSRFGLAFIEDEDPRGGRVLNTGETEKLETGMGVPYHLRLPDGTACLRRPRGECRTLLPTEFGKDIIPMLMENHRVWHHKHSGYWGYTRTIGEYYRTSMDVLGDKPRLDIRSWQLRTNMADRSIRGPATGLRRVLRPASRTPSSMRLRHQGPRGPLHSLSRRDRRGREERSSRIPFSSSIQPSAEAHVKRTIADTGCVISETGRVGGAGDDLACVIGMGTVIPEGESAYGAVPRSIPSSRPTRSRRRSISAGRWSNERSGRDPSGRRWETGSTSSSGTGRNLPSLSVAYTG